MENKTKIALGVLALLLLASTKGKAAAYIDVYPNWTTGTLTFDMGIKNRNGIIVEKKTGSAYVKAGYGDEIDIAFTGTLGKAVFHVVNDPKRVMLTVLCCLPQQYILARKIVDFDTQKITKM